ncbi:MAG TPA: DUF2171 domain-containing protein [Gaiellaceae bacterium]
MTDPVAWNVIERGWKVFDAAGEEIGSVDEVTGDENVDIFDGITISHGVLTKPHYVPSESVTQIVAGEVHLSLSQAEVEKLAAYEEPVAERILPESASWWRRLLGR